MTQYTKPTVLPAWGESAGGADVLQPSNAEIQAGWLLSNVPPSRKRFNWILKYVAQGVRYMMQRGIPEWDAAEDYRINDRVMGSDGKTYQCIQAGINQNPTTQTAYWVLWGNSGRDDQLQLTTAFTTAGTAPNFTLTPVPAPAALAANLRFRVKFHAAGAGSDQLNIAGLGNKSVKQYDNSGAKTSAVIKAGQLCDLEYDGTDLVILDPLPPATSASIQGVFKNLRLSSPGTNANVLVTADELSLKDASGNSYLASNINLTINSAGTEANGIDTGTLAANTWYAVWAIWNGTTLSGLISTSSTTPTLPGGYTHRARVGWIRTDGTANKYPLSFFQAGRRVQYKVAAGTNVTALPQMASGAAGSISTPTWVSVATGNFVPPTAGLISVLAAHSALTSGSIIVAPNNSYGPSLSVTNPPPIDTNANGGNTARGLADIGIETSNIYWAAVLSTSALFCRGWEDNI